MRISDWSSYVCSSDLFDTIAKAGSRMGTGLLTVVDHKQNMISVVRNLEEFFSRESCGWCTPCRDGLPWSVKMLMALEQGRGHASDLVQLEHLTKLLGPGRTFCAQDRKSTRLNSSH